MLSIVRPIKAEQTSDCYAALLLAAASHTRRLSVLTLRVASISLPLPPSRADSLRRLFLPVVLLFFPLSLALKTEVSLSPAVHPRFFGLL